MFQRAEGNAVLLLHTGRVTKKGNSRLPAASLPLSAQLYAACYCYLPLPIILPRPPQGANPPSQALPPSEERHRPKNRHVCPQTWLT